MCTALSATATVSFQEETLEREPGMSLSGRLYLAGNAAENSGEEPWNLIIIHGACEHGGRFLPLANRAAAAGFRVFLPDQRGHGRSSGEVVHVDRFTQYLEDLIAWMEKLDFLPERTFLVGNSMGGLVSIRLNQWWARQTGQPVCAGLFLLSPLLGIKHPIAAWKKQAARLLSQFFPETRFRSTIDPRELTHSQSALEARQKDPLQRQQVTARWYLEVNQAIQLAFAEPEWFWPTTWLYQAGDDRVVDPAAAMEFGETINHHSGQQQVQTQLLEGWFHDVLNEPEGAQIAAQLIGHMKSIRESSASFC